jgi:hypothetical protein
MAKNKVKALGTPNGARPSGGASHGNAISEIKPDQDEVRRRAYELYLRRTAAGEQGSAASDWIKAERGLKATLHA